VIAVECLVESVVRDELAHALGRPIIVAGPLDAVVRLARIAAEARSDV
jgi:hypothetical protein